MSELRENVECMEPKQRRTDGYGVPLYSFPIIEEKKVLLLLRVNFHMSIVKVLLFV